MSQEMALLMGCFLQLWYILASFITWFTIDRLGRRLLFISMALGMAAVLCGEAICVAIGGNKAAIAAVVFVFAFEACFTWGWMGKHRFISRSRRQADSRQVVYGYILLRYSR